MKLSDEEWQSLMIDLIDGQLTGEMKEMVERRIAQSTIHQHEHEALKQLLAAFAQSQSVVPTDELRANFSQLLAGEKQRMADHGPSKHLSAETGGNNAPAQIKDRRWATQRSMWLQIAASVVLLAGAFWLGQFTLRGPLRAAEREVGRLRAEVQASNQLVMLSLLKQNSASDRIKAVGYANEMAEVDEEITKALLNTLNFDPNINVRLAAAEALARFGDQPQLRLAVVASFAKQTEPMIQITLIGLLIDWQEKRALGPMQQLMEDEAAPKIVRAKAAEGVGALYRL